MYSIKDMHLQNSKSKGVREEPPTDKLTAKIIGKRNLLRRIKDSLGGGGGAAALPAGVDVDVEAMVDAKDVIEFAL